MDRTHVFTLNVFFNGSWVFCDKSKQNMPFTICWGHFIGQFSQVLFSKIFEHFFINFTRNFKIYIDQFTLAAAKPWLDRFNYFLNVEGFGLPPPLSHHPPLPAPSRPLPVPLSSSSSCSLHVFHCFITPTLNRLLGPASEHQTG